MSQANGVVIGIVTQVRADGRIKVAFPWLDATYESDWIRVASVMAGKDRGAFFMPEVDDEVVLAFEHGDTRFPMAIGFLWNGVDTPPGKHVRERVFKSKNGHAIHFYDTTVTGGNKGGVVIEDGHKNRITLSNGQVSIRSQNAIVIEGSSIVLRVNGVNRVVTPNGNPI